MSHLLPTADSAAICRQQQEWQSEADAERTKIDQFAELCTPAPHLNERVIRDLYWCLWSALRETWDLYHQEDLDHDASTCWRCLCVKRLEAIEGSYSIREGTWARTLQEINNAA